MNEYKLFAQRSGLIGISNLLIISSSLLTLFFLTKTFSVQEYGIWVEINVTIVLIPNIALLGLPFTMMRFLAPLRDRGEVQEGFYTIVFILVAVNLVASLLLFLFAGSISAGLFGNNIEIGRILALIILPANFNVLLLYYFRTFLQVKRYSILTAGQACSSAIVTIFLVLTGLSIVGVVFGLLLVQSAFFIFMMSLIVSEIGFQVPRFTNVKEYLSFSLPLAPAYLAGWVLESSDRYIIGFLLGATFVAHYSPGYDLGSAVFLVTVPMTAILTPFISAKYDNAQEKEAKKTLEFTLKYFYALAVPFAAWLSLLSRPLLTVLSNPTIAANGYLITPFVSVSALAVGVAYITMQGLILKKKTKASGLVWTFAAILNFGANFLLVPVVGIVGAAVTTLVSDLLIVSLITYVSRTYFRFPLASRFLGKVIFSSLVMGVFILVWSPQNAISLISLVLPSAVVYVATMFLVKGFTREELLFLKYLVRSSMPTAVTA